MLESKMLKPSHEATTATNGGAQSHQINRSIQICRNAQIPVNRIKENASNYPRFEKDSIILGQSGGEEPEDDDEKTVILNNIFRCLTIHQWSSLTKLSLAVRMVECPITTIGYNIGKNLANLRYLKLETLSMEDIDVAALMVPICRNLRSLQTLKLKFWGAPLTDISLELLGSEIGNHLNKLKFLDILFEGCDIDGDGLEAFGRHVHRHLTQLEHLGFYFRECIYIGDGSAGVKELQDVFSDFPQGLKSMKLSFLSLCNQDVKDPFPFERLASLRHLRYYEKCSELDDEQLEALAVNIATPLVELSLLKLTFDSCGYFSSKGMVTFLTHIGKSLRKLRSFTLRTSGCHIDIEQVLKAIGTEVSTNFPLLRELSLKFTDGYSNSLSDEVLEEFADALKRNDVQLQKLSLTFDSKISEECQEKVKKTLEFIPNVEIKRLLDNDKDSS